MRYVLGVEPLDNTDEMFDRSAAERGTLVHAILEDFIGTRGPLPPDQPWSTDDRHALLEIAERHCDNAVQRGLTGADLLWQRSKRNIVADVVAFLNADDARRRTHGRTTVATELPFGIGDAPPVEIGLGERTLRLRGKADPVDRTVDGSLVVVDYKTGSTRTFEKLSHEDPTLHGEKLQLPVYALAAPAVHGEPGTRPAGCYARLSPVPEVKEDERIIWARGAVGERLGIARVGSADPPIRRFASTAVRTRRGHHHDSDHGCTTGPNVARMWSYSTFSGHGRFPRYRARLKSSARSSATMLTAAPPHGRDAPPRRTRCPTAP
jgi:hypothetical protein